MLLLTDHYILNMSENEEYAPNIMSQSADELIDIANETVESNTITRRTLSTQTKNMDISSENTNVGYYHDYQQIIKQEEYIFISMLILILLTYGFTTTVSFALLLFK